ncbi:MAG: ComF family protein [bacterium]|nr:ComF family protein [bacterium]
MLFSFSKLIKNANEIWVFFLDLIFPKECLGCGREGTWLCQKCFSNIKLRSEHSCLACKQKTSFAQFCPSCVLNYDLDGVLIAGYYEQKIISKLIKSFKYYFIRELYQDLGKILILFLNDFLNKKGQKFNFQECLIMPVPLSAYRRRWRGFNQAEILARLVADHFNLELSVNELIRNKHTKPQVKLNKMQRENNIKGCFSWCANNLEGRQIILVDDVVTTGATLNECAKILKHHGASKVWGLVVANG